MAPVVGRRFGLLTVREDLGPNPRGVRYYLCECDCGDLVARAASNLLGRAPGCRQSCQQCVRPAPHAQRAALAAVQRHHAIRAFRKQWDRVGSLWSPHQEGRLVALVQRALVEDGGPMRESYRGPTAIDESTAWAPPPAYVGPADGEPNRPDDGCYTLEEVAKVLGVSRERARQLEATALRKFARGLYALCPDLWEGRKFNPRAHVSAGQVRRRAATVRAAKAAAVAAQKEAA